MNPWLWINKRLLVQDPQGSLYPPGGGRQKRWVQPDGSEVTIIARGDEFDLLLANKQRAYTLTMTPRTAIRLALWVLVWFVWTTWFGVKLALWYASLRGVVNRRSREQRHG